MRWYIRRWYKANEENRCSSNLKIRPYHIAPLCVNAFALPFPVAIPSPRSCLSSLSTIPPSSTYNPSSQPREPFIYTATLQSACRNETKECNSSAPAVVPSRDFPLFAKTYGAKSGALFLKYFQR